MVRISGGTAKGRKIGRRKAFSKSREASDLRPTSAKVRKAVFDILQGRLEGSRFLDLYAGTGAVGIEAISRGAQSVVFVDDSALRIREIEDAVVSLRFADRATLVRANAIRFLMKTDSFDIIFIDPPYSSGELDLILPLIHKQHLLNNRGVVIVEHSSKHLMQPVIGGLRQCRTYRYGDTSLTLYEKEKTHETWNLSGDI